jgi:MFS transporter, DHA1 family, inner membrane transport protein
MVDTSQTAAVGTAFAPRSLMSTVILALGTFAVGTDIFVIAGFLPSMAQSLHASTAEVGQSVTAFAISFAVLAPILAAATTRIPRKTVLIGALIILCVANIISAAAVNLVMLIASRIFASVGAAIYTPVATAVSAMMVRPDQRTRAMAIVGAGLAISTALGVPLGALVSQWMGWRAALVLVAAMFLLPIVGISLLLPQVPLSPAIGLRERLAVLRRSDALIVLPLTVLGMAATYLPYAYIVPAMTSAGVLPIALPGILFLYGAGAVCGNLTTGIATDRWGPITVLRTVYVAMALALGLIWLMSVIGAPSIALAGGASFVWGMTTWMQTPPQQQRLITAMPAHGAVVIALNSSSIYVGIGLGTTLGGLAIATSPRNVFGFAATAAIAALVYLLVSVTRTTARAKALTPG